jgi:putative tributyrin esterase
MRKGRWYRLIVLSAVVGVAAAGAVGQLPYKTFLEYEKDGGHLQQLESKLMGRTMPYWVILPKNYFDKEESGRVYPVIYLLHGLTGRFSDWPQRTGLATHTMEMNAIIVSVEGGNGWYTDSATNDKDRYESYIIRELIPDVQKKFRASDRRDQRAIAGLSMGGYGAIKFGLKYPEMFVLAGSFSGALGAATLPESGSGSSGLASISAVFGPQDSETRKANDIFKMVREIESERAKKLPFFYIDCGTEDFLFQNNRDFIELLVQKRIRHEYRQLPGGHTWIYWSRQLPEFLEVARQML